MRKLRVVSLILLCITILLLWTACGSKPDTSGNDTSEPIGTAPPMLPIDITTVITREQVSTALGTAVGEGETFEDGTALYFASDDAQTHAEIHMMECSRDIYDATAVMYADAVGAPNLGEIAIWSETSKQVILYAKGYMISVTADIPNKTSDELLVAARQMALSIIEAL